MFDEKKRLPNIFKGDSMSTTNYIQLSSDGVAVSHLADSVIVQNGTSIGVGTASAGTKLHVNGAITVGGAGAPQIVSGSGAPSASLPNGSLYLRTDGTGPNLYVRQNGAWVSK
ncbi:MAG: hypothetical protein MUF22_04500 [Chitinispirillaceae bacterium]|jgi:hypothetical protein|nr:hypothetical protein [Chitinispirillaceae bacterium]